MWKFATSIMEKLVELTPLRAFFKYVFQRLSNDFLDHQPNIDFKKGELQLLDLPLSANKINQTFLMSSPYILQSGIIKRLKITLPNLSQIATKSIEIELSGLELVLYPNKDFHNRFNQEIKRMKEMLKFYDVEEKEMSTIKIKKDEELDFFKEIIKQILTNIKVNVNNVNVRLFMNTPSQSKENIKPQYYLMLRVPSVVAERCKLEELESQSENQEEQKYMFRVKQVSLHLLREDMSVPEYDNTKYTKQDFPSHYPPVNHPSTILLIGSDGSENQIRPHSRFLQFFITIQKQLQARTKELSLSATIPNIQLHFQPCQLRILSHFLLQLNQFSNIYKLSMQELRRQDVELYRKFADIAQDSTLRQTIREGLSIRESRDLFSSMAFKYEDLQFKQEQLKQKQRLSYFDKIMAEQNNQNIKEMKAGMKEMEKVIDQETKEKIKKKVLAKFDTKMTIEVQVDCVRVYLQKYSTGNSLVDYERSWAEEVEGKFLLINKHVPASYFMFNIQGIDVRCQNFNLINLDVENVSLLNVKLTESTTQQMKQDDFEEVDVFKSFSDDNAKNIWDSDKRESTKGSKHLKKLVKFEKSQSQHYCASYILWVSEQNPIRCEETLDGIIHCNISEFPDVESYHKHNVGISISMKKVSSKENSIVINVGRVGCVLDSEIMKDFVNIGYPLFTYRTLAQNINLKKQQLNDLIENNEQTLAKANNINYSMYDISLALQPQFIRQESKPSSKIKVQTKQTIAIMINRVTLTFTDNHFIDQDLISIQKTKTKDKDSFSSKCFCDGSLNSVNVEMRGMKIALDKKQKILFNSLIVSTARFANRKLKEKFELLKVWKEGVLNRVYLDGVEEKGEQNVEVFIPLVEVSIIKEECIPIIRMVQKVGLSLVSLDEYYKYLKGEFRKVQSSFLKPLAQTKSKPLQQIQSSLSLFIQNVEVRAFNAKICLSNLYIKNIDQSISVKIDNLLILYNNISPSSLQNMPIITKTSIRGFDKQIFTSEIIVCLDLNKQQKKKLETFSNQTSHGVFSKMLDQYPFAISVQIFGQNQQEPKENSKRFSRQSSAMLMSFRKQKRTESIKQKYEEQNIIVVFDECVYVRPCDVKNLVLINQDISELKQIYEQSRISEISFQNIIEHQQRQQVEKKPIQLIARLIFKQLCIDIFPFQDLRQSEFTLACTRSYFNMNQVSLEIELIEKISPTKQKLTLTKIDAQFKHAELFFLAFFDKNVQLNPLIIDKSELFNYGFKKIIELGLLSASVFQQQHGDKDSKLEASLMLDSVAGEFSASTTVYLQHHIDTLQLLANYIIQKISKSIPKSQPKQNPPNQTNEDEDDCAVLIDEFSIPQQSQEQKEFKSRTPDFIYNISGGKFTKLIDLKSLEIKKIAISIFSGNEFEFIHYEKGLITEESMIEFNDMYEVIDEGRIPEGKLETRKRFRISDANRKINFRLHVQEIVISFCKLKNFENSQEFNIRAVLKIGAIKAMINKNEDDIFYLLKTSSTLTLLIQIVDLKIKIKSDLPNSIKAGYLSAITFIQTERATTQQNLKKLRYFQPLQQAEQVDVDSIDQVYHLMVLLPPTRLIITLQMNSINILKNQQITTKLFYFNNKLSKYYEQDNKSTIMTWIKETLTSNIGSVLTGTVLSIFAQAIWFLLKCLKRVIFLPVKFFTLLN